MRVGMSVAEAVRSCPSPDFESRAVHGWASPVVQGGRPSLTSWAAAFPLTLRPGTRRRATTLNIT